MEYYSSIKKDEILPFLAQMDPENIMLSEINQTRKAYTVSFHLYVESQNNEQA